MFSQFVEWVRNGGDVKLVVLFEFVNLVLVLFVFQVVYGFMMKFEQFVVLLGGDIVVIIQVVVNGISGVNVVMVYGMDGVIFFVNLCVL